MRIFDVPAITHGGGGIFSVDVNPSNNKLATAGQDKSGGGLLIIWDISFLTQPESGPGPDKCTRMENYGALARIPHTKSINCVRWSPSHSHSKSQQLVCCGDDPTIHIYECTGTFTCNNRIQQETYRCTNKLFGHLLDVLHVDWSPCGSLIASCSLDNTIIIWNIKQQSQWDKVAVLRASNGGHSRGVKGLAWDPMGRYLATQAEDNSLKVWKVDGWECVHTFTEPFMESTSTSLFCRMSWSPDGAWLIAPCAMNNGGPTARIICRRSSNWSCERDLVGFRKAVGCTRSHPYCFNRNGSSTKAVSLIATGSRDRSLAVWAVPGVGRPLLVLEKAFRLSVLDLAWTSDGTLVACSRDGAIKMIQFMGNELGKRLVEEEMRIHIGHLYGTAFSQSMVAPPLMDNSRLDASKVEWKVPDRILRQLAQQFNAATTTTNGPPPEMVCNISVEGGLLKLPKQQRLLLVNIPCSSGVNRVEVVNSSGSGSGTRISGFDNNSITAIWTVYTERIVSLMAANSAWTVIATFDGHLIAYSTPTGRCILQQVHTEPIVFLQLNGDYCTVISNDGILGHLKLGGELVFKKSIREMLTGDSKMISFSLVEEGNAGVMIPTIQLSDGQRVE